MSVQPDIIWNEQCLGIRIGEQVCIYLKKHNAEYQRLQKKILEFTEKFINKKYDTIVNENEFSKSELGGMKIFY